eukprot:911575-Pleurochrysis_carterae.AAC.1
MYSSHLTHHRCEHRRTAKHTKAQVRKLSHTAPPLPTPPKCCSDRASPQHALRRIAPARGANSLARARREFARARASNAAAVSTARAILAEPSLSLALDLLLETPDWLPPSDSFHRALRPPASSVATPVLPSLAASTSPTAKALASSSPSEGCDDCAPSVSAPDPPKWRRVLVTAPPHARPVPALHAPAPFPFPPSPSAAALRTLRFCSPALFPL